MPVMDNERMTNIRSSIWNVGWEYGCNFLSFSYLVPPHLPRISLAFLSLQP